MKKTMILTLMVGLSLVACQTNNVEKNDGHTDTTTQAVTKAKDIGSTVADAVETKPEDDTKSVEDSKTEDSTKAETTKASEGTQPEEENTQIEDEGTQAEKENTQTEEKDTRAEATKPEETKGEAADSDSEDPRHVFSLINETMSNAESYLETLESKNLESGEVYRVKKYVMPKAFVQKSITERYYGELISYQDENKNYYDNFGTWLYIPREPRTFFPLLPEEPEGIALFDFKPLADGYEITTVKPLSPSQEVDLGFRSSWKDEGLGAPPSENDKADYTFKVSKDYRIKEILVESTFHKKGRIIRGEQRSVFSKYNKASFKFPSEVKKATKDQ